MKKLTLILFCTILFSSLSVGLSAQEISLKNAEITPRSNRPYFKYEKLSGGILLIRMFSFLGYYDPEYKILDPEGKLLFEGRLYPEDYGEYVGRVYNYLSMAPAANYIDYPLEIDGYQYENGEISGSSTFRFKMRVWNDGKVTNTNVGN